MKTKRFMRYAITGMLLILIFQSCTTISLYDQYAYNQTTSLKVEALSLMDQATESYTEQQETVEALQMKIEKAYEYEKNRPKNEITIKMWEILKSQEKNLLGGFITRWKNEGKLNSTFISEAKLQIAEGFDYIAQLESGKIKASDSGLQSFIAK
jgi:lipopolysaccharide biosynthesis protein